MPKAGLYYILPLSVIFITVIIFISIVRAQSRKTVDSKTDKSDQVPTLMSSDMHREAMRQKWEKEMRELQEKGQQEIHYSNIRFDGQYSSGLLCCKF